MSSSAPLTRPAPPLDHQPQKPPKPAPGTRATLAVVAHAAAGPAHRDLQEALPGCSVRTWSSDDAEAMLDDVAHRDLVRFAARGAVIGSVLLGVLTLALTVVAAGQPIGVGVGLGAAVALTGGIFFGSLMGFFAATLRWEDARAELRSHGRSAEGPGVVIVEGVFDGTIVGRILQDHDAIAVSTTAT